MNLFSNDRKITTPEPTTIKEAGFNHIWGAFLKKGLDSKRSFGRIERLDEVDEFSVGYNEAIDKIANLTEYDEGQLLFFEMTQDMPPEQIMKLAEETVLPDEKMRGFLEASQLVLESNQDLNTIAWNGPNKQETIAMNDFEIGKVAAFNALVDLADEGYEVGDLIDAATNEIQSDVKIASVEDQDYRLGVESVCHDVYVKVAELHGNYDTESATSEELVEALLLAIRPDELEKEASEEEVSEEEVSEEEASSEGDEFYDNVVEHLNENLTEEDIEKVAEVILDVKFERSLEKEASEEEVEYYNSAVDFLESFDNETQEKIAEVILDHVDDEVIAELEKEASVYSEVRKSGYGRGSAAKAQLRGAAGRKEVAKAGLGLAAVGAAGLGAKKLNDKRKAKKEGKMATASDDKLTQAYAVLKEAGLLED